MAEYHSSLMRKGKRIRHGLWGGLYLVLAAGISALYPSWWLFLLALIIRKVVFDISLNLFNRRHPFFVSTETTSIIDKLHYSIFRKHMWIWVILYTAGWVVVNVKR